MQHYCIRLAQIALWLQFLIEVWAVVEDIVFSELDIPVAPHFRLAAGLLHIRMREPDTRS